MTWRCTSSARGAVRNRRRDFGSSRYYAVPIDRLVSLLEENSFIEIQRLDGVLHRGASAGRAPEGRANIRIQLSALRAAADTQRSAADAGRLALRASMEAEDVSAIHDQPRGSSRRSPGR